jgi:flagellar basal-body rod protein FlgF
MDVSLYSAAAAMNATERWQDLVADNLSVTSVPGARQRDVVFSASAGLNFLQGKLNATGADLDFAAEGPGFFTVKMTDGSTVYTRDGQFRLNEKGELTTKEGYQIVSDGGAVRYDPNNRAPLKVSPMGEVSQGADLKGRISITEFGNLKSLTKLMGGYYSADPVASQPVPATNTSVRQGYVEESNASPMLAMTSLITSMRMFESNQKVMTMQSDRMSKTITELSGT